MFLLCTAVNTSSAQPSTYYDRQAQNRAYDNLHAATTRAFSVPTTSFSSSVYKSPSTSSVLSTSSSSSYGSKATGTIAPASANSWAMTDHYDWQVRQGEKRERANGARQAAFEQSKAKFKSLITNRGIARTEADHFDLLLTGMRAAIDASSIFAVIGNNIEEYRVQYGTGGAPFKAEDPATLLANMYISAALLERNPLVRTGLYAEAIKKFPTPELTQKLADAYREAHKYTDAIIAYRRSDSIESNRFGVFLGWATACAMQGEAVEAEKLYLRALSLAPGAPVDMNIAWMRMLQKNNAGAIESLKAEAAQHPREPGPLLAEAALTADPDERAKRLKDVAVLLPELASNSLPQMLFSYAKYLQNDGAYELSIFFLDMAVNVEPKNIDFLELRYGTNKKLGRYKQADADELIMGNL